MKPYKIIKNKNNYLKKPKILGPLKRIKLPFVFFKDTFTPSKGKIIVEKNFQKSKDIEADHQQDS